MKRAGAGQDDFPYEWRRRTWRIQHQLTGVLPHNRNAPHHQTKRCQWPSDLESQLRLLLRPALVSWRKTDHKRIALFAPEFSYQDVDAVGASHRISAHHSDRDLAARRYRQGDLVAGLAYIEDEWERLRRSRYRPDDERNQGKRL